MHLNNPELQTDAVLISLAYLVWGIFMALLTLRTNGLELAIGIHAANNLFSELIVTRRHSSVQLNTLYYLDNMNPLIQLVFLSVVSVIIIKAAPLLCRLSDKPLKEANK